MKTKLQVQITPEEKARWKPILRATWDAIAYDVIQVSGGECNRATVVEFVCDAGRPMVDYGSYSMTGEEYRVLSKWYGSPTFKRWIREDVFPCNSYVE